jgi:adenylate cyclase
MESVAPPGGVMLSESTARLVQDNAVLDEPEMVHVKGADEPVSARRLLSMAEGRRRDGLCVSTLVGREWELASLTAMLDRSVNGARVCSQCGWPTGIGKSRIVAETAAIAESRGVAVFSTFRYSHAGEVPFHASTRLLRAALGIEELDDEAARTHVRVQVPGADPADLLLLDDALASAKPPSNCPTLRPTPADDG